jgi:hypothetical protein
VVHAETIPLPEAAAAFSQLSVEMIAGADEDDLQILSLPDSSDRTVNGHFGPAVTAHGIKGNPHGGVGLAELLLELENGPALVHAAATAQLVPHLRFAALGTLADARPGQSVMCPALSGPRMGMSSFG